MESFWPVLLVCQPRKEEGVEDAELKEVSGHLSMDSLTGHHHFPNLDHSLSSWVQTIFFASLPHLDAPREESPSTEKPPKDWQSRWGGGWNHRLLSLDLRCFISLGLGKRNLGRENYSGKSCSLMSEMHSLFFPLLLLLPLPLPLFSPASFLPLFPLQPPLPLAALPLLF